MSEAVASRARIDVHPSQLGRGVIHPFEAEHADELRVLGRDPERSPALAIVRRDPIDLLDERSLDVALESILEMRRCKLAIDADEEVANRGEIRIGVTSDRRQGLSYAAGNR